MKYFLSLKTKLFVWISLLILAFVLFSLLMNTQFMKPYYMSIQKKQHIEIADTLSKLYPDQNEELWFEIERIRRLGGYRVFIFDENGSIVLNTTNQEDHPSPPIQNPPLDKNPSPPIQNSPLENSSSLIQNPPMNNSSSLNQTPPLDNNLSSQRIISLESIIEAERLFLEVHDPRLNINYLDMYTTLKDNKVLLLSGQIESMETSINIATRFFMLTGLIFLVIGSFAAFLFSRNFTKPIIELKAIAASMSLLDFSHKYQLESNDEIGELGSSINSLSDQLFHSISDLRDANSKLKEDIEKERKIDQMRKEFVSNVSHELKTPISLIQGYAEGLKQNIVDDEENKNYYCEVIIDEALKMEKHVKELLELSQLESGVFTIDCADFDLSLLINEIMAKYNQKFKEKQIILQIFTNLEHFVFADRIRIEQVIINYINNAMNHIDENKKIIIKTNLTTENKIRLSVFNSGPVIPEEEMGKIWDSYYKVDKARTRTYGGSGLGLSIVKAIQEKHGNGYGVENITDGVSFWIDLSPTLDIDLDVDK